MHILMTVFKSILAKYCTATIIERVVIWGLGVLVKKQILKLMMNFMK